MRLKLLLRNCTVHGNLTYNAVTERYSVNAKEWEELHDAIKQETGKLDVIVNGLREIKQNFTISGSPYSPWLDKKINDLINESTHGKKEG